MALITVEPKIFDLMKRAYSQKFGSSAKQLSRALQKRFKDKLEDARGQNIISEKTIYNFFNDNKQTKRNEQYVNYLCAVLLEYNSYQEALQALEESEQGNSDLDKKATEEINIQEDWLDQYREYIERKCGTIQVLDMTEPVLLDSIYTPVNISENIRGRERRSIDELLVTLLEPELEADKSYDFRRLSFKLEEKVTDGLEAVKHNKRLIVFGHPGKGKTTLLKYLALYYLQNYSEEDLVVPVYISLRTFAENKELPSLSDAITREFAACISDADQLNKVVQNLLKQGKCLILLDGLDEILQADTKRVYQNIDEIVEKYPNNHFVITCRIAASEYIPLGFKKVEIASFDKNQVIKFVHNWFSNRDEHKVGDKLLEKLENNQSVKELAKTPLLLTILCWVFEDSNNFPKNRNELYSEAVDTLLRRWDASRRIERDPIYKDEKLSRPRKINMFSKIAYDGFKQKPRKVFWKKRELEEQICSYIKNIPGVEKETLDIDSQAVLKRLEANHGLLIEAANGVYSFSHLTFQEYFTAEYIVESRDNCILNEIILQHLTNPQWREVFLLIAERLENADEFFKLIFNRCNELVKSEPLQKMLTWLDKITTESGVSSSSWRALYLTIDIDVDLYISNDLKVHRTLAETLSTQLRTYNIERNKTIPTNPKCSLEMSLVVVHILASDYASSLHSAMESYSQFVRERLKLTDDSSIESKLENAISLAKTINATELANELIALQKNLPSNYDISELSVWAENLRQVMLKYLDIGYQVTLSEEDTQALQQYLYVNNLLIECIRGDNYSSANLREQIIEHMLLPSDRISSELRPSPLFR
ncbi:NACHT domain-containing protein [Fischerella sp. PCC 9605]|uniref:NACHT domain-containing protein n=1 Tax=Fischerella sp. PCC 9605 TaxID=1173024 RepID=UPI0004B0852F|nr:NACHT domain-containing protein [Fischerella sp. PCC 9605]